MDLDKYLKTVTNLNEYISFTRDVENGRNNLKIPFNMSTVLSLKNIRSIEIEYFNKCEENGAATTILELMLRSAPSKTWSLLGKELVGVFQYWLEALRKHLIVHNMHWWTFLKLLLKFIKDIHSKDVSMNKVLIEETADCLLDLATHPVPEAAQRYEIIQTFNSICAESSRNIRFAYRDRFQNYFVKLSTLLVSAGDLRLQYSILETLLRWLLPRHDPSVRMQAATRWFPTELYSRSAVEIFLERPWQNFMKDARDFLNIHNESGDLVTSVACTKLTIGKNLYVAKPKKEYWLDVNQTTKCLSFLLDPKLSESLGETNQICDALVFTEDNTCRVEMNKISHQVVISVAALDISRVYPFAKNILDGSTDVSVTVDLRSDFVRLDRSLRGVFGEKYQILFDVENMGTNCPDENRESLDVINDTEVETRFSIPIEVRRRKHSGYIVRPRIPGLLNSPSTVSTSSLALLHEKLAALPPYTYDKEPVSVCAQPQLSSVTEVSESEDNHTTNASSSTIRLRTYGVSRKANRKNTSKGDSSSENSRENQILNVSPVLNDNENSVSCLLAATIGSADDSIINDTIDRLPKDIPCNTDNIVDLLAREALKETKDKQGTSNKSDECQINYFQIEKCSKGTSEINKKVITDTEFTRKHYNLPLDESSNEIVENTPAIAVPVRSKRRTRNNSLKPTVKPSKVDNTILLHDNQEIENFFTQHVSENRHGELVISPTLARKINETSSECSEDFDQCLITYAAQDDNIDHPFESDVDIVECLNAMVDKVCLDFDKCANYLDLGTKSTNKNNEDQNTINSCDKSKSKEIEKQSKALKLKFTQKRSLSCKRNVKSNKKISKDKPFSVMSPIIERESIVDESTVRNANPESTATNIETPKQHTTRRKRKLYSPKDDIFNEENVMFVVESAEDNSTTNSEPKVYCKTPKTTATCYKDLERERKTRIRQPRNRKSTTNINTPSPRTLKRNKIFDNLKEVVEGEIVKLVDKSQFNEDIAGYNYTSDSEDEDAKNKNKVLAVKQQSSTETIKATNKSRARKTPKNKTKKSAEVEVAEKTKPTKPKPRTTKRNLSIKHRVTKSHKENISEIRDPKFNLEDERMRAEAPEVLNTSIIIENPQEAVNKEPEPVLRERPQMESIIIEDHKSVDNNDNVKNTKQKGKRMLSLKRNKESPKPNLELSVFDNERTVSPLPGLVVETILVTEEDANDSVTTNMLQKCKDIYQGKPVDEASVANKTQNLLSDAEAPNCSQIQLNITEEFDLANERNENISKKVTEKSTKDNKNAKGKKLRLKKEEILKVKLERRSSNKVVDEPEVIQLSNTEVSEKTMATLGNTHSPITGHGDFNEDPPSGSLLEKDIEPRIVEQEYFNQSLKEFFANLNKNMHVTEEVPVESDDNASAKSKSDCSTKSHNRSPVVALTRLSTEDIKTLTSKNSKSQTVKSKSVQDTKMNSKENTTEEDSNAKITRSKSQLRRQNSLSTVRKTMISPVKLFEDMNTKMDSPSSKKSSEHGPKLRPKKPTQSEANDKRMANKKSPLMKKTVKKTLITSSPISSHLSMEEESRIGSTKTASRVSKRKSSPILRSSKRLRLEDNNNFGDPIVVESMQPSLSSVNEWFKRNEPCAGDDNLNQSIKETVKNVLEKLDTTLLEIHHNTSKRFINMFVDAQRHLAGLVEKRQELYKQTASDIISGVVRLMDEKFSDLDRRSKKMDEEFMKGLKAQAHELMRADCKQKRVMVALLRDDAQAALHQLSQNKSSESL